MKIPKSSSFYVYYKLDPCPLCNGEAKLVRRRPMTYLDTERLVTYVKCQQCHTRTGFRALDEYKCAEDAWEAVVNHWNTRFPTPF